MKFKVWDTGDNKFFKFENEMIIISMNDTANGYTLSIKNKNEIIKFEINDLELYKYRYSGLLDKNKNEIIEKDVLTNGHVKVIIEYNDKFASFIGKYAHMEGEWEFLYKLVENGFYKCGNTKEKLSDGIINHRSSIEFDKVYGS